jgi:hypothetical protein
MILRRLIKADYKTIEPKHNDRRTIEQFLFFPRTIRGETRWLERVRIHQYFSKPFSYSFDNGEWKDVEFVEIPKANE